MPIMSIVFIVMAYVFYNVSIEPFSTNTLLKGIFFLDNVLIYIAALEILKASLSQRKILNDIKFNPNFFSYHQTSILSLVSAFPFGLGVSSFLGGLSKEEINIEPISKGMTASMLIYPTTLASGFVFDSFRLTSLTELFLFGIPIVIFLLLPWQKGSLSVLAKSNLFRIIVVLCIVNFVYLLCLSQFIANYFMLKQSAFFVIIALIISPSIILSTAKILWKARKLFIFFICVGILGDAFIRWINQLELLSALEWLNVYNAIAIVIFIIPLLSIVFIHPLVLFLIFNPLISPFLLNNGVSEISVYTIWVVMLINSQLLSPVSLTTVLSVSNSNSNIFTESFLKYSTYSLKVSCISYIYILLSN